jgi:hypothetical protein
MAIESSSFFSFVEDDDDDDVEDVEDVEYDFGGDDDHSE